MNMILDRSAEQAYLWIGDARAAVDADEFRVWAAYAGIDLRSVGRLTEQLILAHEHVYELVLATWWHASVQR